MNGILKLEIVADKIVNNMADSVLADGVGVIKAGNNGPYYDEETAVRNYAHWCVSFAKFFFKTRDEKFRKLVIILGDAILSSDAYNGQGVYKCREFKKGDEVNGVIGAAWIIEGLIYAYKVTSDDRYYERAAEIFKVVPFNQSLGIWNRINTKNEKLTVDATFNHQLWFAAAGAMIYSIKKDALVKQYLDRFIERLPVNITIRKNGRIGHFTLNDKNGWIGYIGRIYRDLKNDMKEKANKPSLAYKETGYHSFNLYGFAILKEYYDNEIAFFNTDKFYKCLDFASSLEYFEMLNSADRALDETNVSSKLSVDFNIFSYAYNSPAFELKRVYETFGLLNSDTEKLLSDFCEKMLELTYDESTKSFSQNTDDTFSLNARIYEL